MKKIVLYVLLPAFFVILISGIVSFFVMTDEEKYNLINPDSYNESSIYYTEGIGEVSLIFSGSDIDLSDLTQKVIAQKVVVDGKKLVEFTQKEVSLGQVKKRVYSDYYLMFRKCFIVFISFMITSFITVLFYKRICDEIHCNFYFCKKKEEKRNE